MPERSTHAEYPSPFELDVIRAFGWALIEFEATLYQKYLRISASRSLITYDDFKSILREMESKGFLQELSFHGKRAYRRLLLESDIEEHVHPEVPLDEIRLALGSLQAKKDDLRYRPKVDQKLVTEPRFIGELILEKLGQWLKQESGLEKLDPNVVCECVERMHHALSESEDAFFEYLRNELPGILAIAGETLRSYGQDRVLLGLRIVESDIRSHL